ncbi:BTB/POZ domain-containing protein 9-like protein [Dinothrombium tinctorium]|uniref:BTB/POZ domain-containing protein 9-like protein n=1 Tax=Dinothrombium tinctorium TaxID=1965070 RepID=A0A3S3P1N1_9ACAR|nr:BTB/POZ domain-containing protein 9-like protein [Dinothrombium tinctorium]
MTESDESMNFATVGKMVGEFYLNKRLSDICFVVEDEKIFAHKFILAVSCQYFHTLLFGETNEAKTNEIVLNHPSKKIFKAVLEYAYKGKAETSDFSPEELLSLISLAHEYQFISLVLYAEKKYNLEFITKENVSYVFEVAYLCALDSLLEKCWVILEEHSEEIIANHELFSTFSSNLFKAILLRDSFFAKEIDIFKAIMAWKDVNHVDDIKSILENLRFNLISDNDFCENIRPLGLFTDTEYIKHCCQEKVNRTPGKCKIDYSYIICSTENRKYPNETKYHLYSNKHLYDYNFILEFNYVLENVYEISRLHFDCEITQSSFGSRDCFCFISLIEDVNKNNVLEHVDASTKKTHILSFNRKRVKHIRFSCNRNFVKITNVKIF